MKYLYIDSSHDLEFGVYNSQQKQWAGFKRVEGAQNSKILHHELYQLLQELDLNFNKITAVVINSGPGSYTGMRLTEGLAQILEWQKIEVYSFYHYQVPAILEIEKYYWISTAFKGEWFIYSHKDQSKKLIRDTQLLDFISHAKPINTHYDFKKNGLIETSHLIHENFDRLLQHLERHHVRESVYYFREAEVEFKTVSQQQGINE